MLFPLAPQRSPVSLVRIAVSNLTMKPYLKTVYREVLQEVDTETGEVIDVVHDTKKIVVNTKEKFFTVYSHIIASLADLTGNDIKLITYIMFKKVNDDGEFANTAEFRESAAKHIGVSPATISRCIAHLVEQRIVFKTKNRITYEINPIYFWKGEMSLRKQKVKLLLELELV